jgi:predicted  nucleic acid-binding Zn-ribbon protein
LGAEIGFGNRGMQRWVAYLDETEKKSKGAAGGAKKLKDEFTTIGETLPELIELTRQYGIEFNPDAKIANAPKLLDRLKLSWTNVSKAVADAQADFTNTQQSVTDTFRGFLSLADAADAYYGRQKAASDALAELTKYRAKLTDEATDSEKEKLKELQQAYQEAQTAAATGAQSIVEEFVAQSKKFGEFGEKLQQLLRAGLNKTSFMQILNMGAERGSDVADSYLKGNTQELVNRTNETVKAYDDLAQTIGTETANTFYQAGLMSAIALLRAFTVAFAKDAPTRKALKAIIADLESDLAINIKTTVSAPSGGGGGGGGGAPAATIEVPTAAAIGPIAQSIGLQPATVAEIKATTTQPPPSGEGRIWAEIRALAQGGLVTRPTLSLIGEAGPEAVIPLNQLGGMGGNITINVNAGMGTDGAEVGRQIVDALKQYQRRNGPIPVAVNG